jgi:hypothetical protein
MMVDLEVTGPGKGPRIGLVLVGVQFERLGPASDDRQEVRHLLFNRSRVRPTEFPLELGATSLLGLGHRPAPAALALGEAVEVVGLLAHGDVVARRVVLAPLVALEAVERQRLSYSPSGPRLLVKQKAVPTQTGADAGNGARRDLVLAGDLAESRATHKAMEDGQEEPRFAQPVGRREGLIAEASTAGVTLVTLHPPG